ncbi:MAG: radical SAM protein [Hyphomicrobiales bacterium]|nr:radical SAM protein [Hyphomicrobiales bacterium]
MRKFDDLVLTAKGERRAVVPFSRLETLWFNTGTLCNITCVNCYIESSPRNDRLAYLSLEEVRRFLDEIERDALPVKLIGFTGGEPFMNPEFPAILAHTLDRGHQTLTLTNAMKPMALKRDAIAGVVARYGPAARFRVSLDDWREAVHDAERGAGSFAKTLDGLRWLVSVGATVEVAGRFLAGDDEAALRDGYAGLFGERGVRIDCADPQALVLLPEMTPLADPPEISEACWGILHKSPDDLMCATSRMVVKRKGAEASVLACTLLPYDERFELGATLAEANRLVPLAHKYCATFCVLGGGSCGASREAKGASDRT